MLKKYLCCWGNKQQVLILLWKHHASWNNRNQRRKRLETWEMQLQDFTLTSTFHCLFYLLWLPENCKTMKLPQSGIKSILLRDCCLPLIVFINMEDYEVHDSFSEELFTVYSLSFVANFIVKNDARSFGEKNRFEKALNKQKMRQNVQMMHMLRESSCFLHFWFSKGISFSSSALRFRGVYRWGASWLWQSQIKLVKHWIQRYSKTSCSYLESCFKLFPFAVQISRHIFHQLVKLFSLPQKQQMIY